MHEIAENIAHFSLLSPFFQSLFPTIHVVNFYEGNKKVITGEEQVNYAYVEKVVEGKKKKMMKDHTTRELKLYSLIFQKFCCSSNAMFNHQR